MDTMPYSAGSAKGAVLIVVENQSVRCCALDVRPEWTFGRATPVSSPDIAVKSEIVGRKHGRFTSLDGQWYYGDGGSINGTLYNGTKISSGINGRVRPIPLQNGDVLRVDTTDLIHPDPRGVMMVFLTAQAEGTWNLYALNKKKTVIGRNAACNIVQDRAYISERHAEITYVNGSYYVTDLKSKDGTWLNGEKITGTVRLKEKDSIALCDCHFILVGDSLIYNQLEKREAYKKASGNRGRVILKADIKTRKVPNRNGRGSKELIRDVHLEIREGTLVALLGGSGAGKSTVMNCLNGMDTSGMEGTVLFYGEDLRKNFNRLSLLIGSVPQENIFYQDSTVEEELTRAAQLRLPVRDVRKRVDEVIRQLKLEKKRKEVIRVCSGGEKKRVNVGIDLVADKKLFCLDEPEAGLDPGSKKEFFEVLHSLAHEGEKNKRKSNSDSDSNRELFEVWRSLAHDYGKSILTIIHDVSDIDMFDQVIIMAKVDEVGRLAFSGSPEEARKAFGGDIRNAYALIEKNPWKYIK